MKQNFFETKEFNSIVKNSKNEVKGVFNNPFVVINLLNKAAKGDFAKIDGCNISRENLAKVAKVLKSMHGNRYAFDACLLNKDNKGRFVTIATSKYLPNWEYQLIDILPNRGYKYYKPISLTISTIYNEFAKIAKVENKGNIDATKAAAKAAAKEQRIKEAKLKELSRAFDKGVITEIEYNTKLSELKSA